MTGSYEDAIIFAIKAHGSQTRWTGEPYITHPLRVAARAGAFALEHDYTIGPVSADWIKKAAILHDVLEDVPSVDYTALEKRFGSEVAKIVQALTRREDEYYRDYIERVLSSDLAALVVKRADLLDNLADLPETHSLQGRYRPALKKIEARLKTFLDR